MSKTKNENALKLLALAATEAYDLNLSAQEFTLSAATIFDMIAKQELKQFLAGNKA